MWTKASRIEAGDDSAAFESTQASPGRKSRVDFFVRGGVFASVEMDLVDDAASSARKDLIEDFDARITAFVAEHGVPD